MCRSGVTIFETYTAVRAKPFVVEHAPGVSKPYSSRQRHMSAPFWSTLALNEGSLRIQGIDFVVTCSWIFTAMVSVARSWSKALISMATNVFCECDPAWELRSRSKHQSPQIRDDIFVGRQPQAQKKFLTSVGLISLNVGLFPTEAVEVFQDGVNRFTILEFYGTCVTLLNTGGVNTLFHERQFPLQPPQSDLLGRKESPSSQISSAKQSCGT